MFGPPIQPPETLGLNHILSFHEDVGPNSGIGQDEVATGALWIGTMGGLIRFSQEWEELSYYRHDPADDNSLGHNQVNDIYRDRSGVLWLLPAFSRTPRRGVWMQRLFCV